MKRPSELLLTRSAQLAVDDIYALPYIRFASALMFGNASPSELANFGSADLRRELIAEFPLISRGDAFTGIAIAWTLNKADRVADLIHARHLQHQLDQQAAR